MRMPVYLDYNATCPVDPEVLDAMLPWFSQKFGNAASANHVYGWQAAEAVKIAREKVAALIGADPSEIVFTSGATESLNLALTGTYRAYSKKSRLILSFPDEHKAVLDTLQALEKEGARLEHIGLTATGEADLTSLAKHAEAGPVIIAAMWANNETGLIRDIAGISEIAAKHQAALVCDATQAAGKIPVDVNAGKGVSMLALSAHKLYGPKGCGALYIRKRNPRWKPEAILHGGGHEHGFRSGTLNVPAIVGFGKAAELAQQRLQEESARIRKLRDHMETTLLQTGKVRINGGAAPRRLPNTLNVCIPGLPADRLIASTPNLAFSTGSACSSALMQPSHVLLAMGLNEADAYASIRISLGRFTTQAEVEEALFSLCGAIEKAGQTS